LRGRVGERGGTGRRVRGEWAGGRSEGLGRNGKWRGAGGGAGDSRLSRGMGWWRRE